MTSSHDREHRNPPAAQWFVAGLGVLLFIGCIAALAYEAFSADGRPPDVTVVADSTLRVSDGWLVRVTVHNAGGRTAANVSVEGSLLQDDSVVERSEFTLDHVPPRSSRTAGLNFTRDPAAYGLDLRATGFTDP